MRGGFRQPVTFDFSRVLCSLEIAYEKKIANDAYITYVASARAPARVPFFIPVTARVRTERFLYSNYRGRVEKPGECPRRELVKPDDDRLIRVHFRYCLFSDFSRAFFFSSALQT